MRREFQADVVNSQLPSLVAPELRGATNAHDIMTGFSVQFDPKFYEFQSDAQGISDVPTSMAKDQSIIRLIDDAMPERLELTADHVLNRLGVLTCGGCHRFSAGKEIAPGVVWPQDAGFVHVTEDGVLSPALTNVFLPQRKRILESFLCEFPPQQFVQGPAGGGPLSPLPENDEPDGEVPDGGEPESDVPDDGEPESDVPEDGEPESDVPEDGEPESDEPDGDESESDLPEDVEPESDEPDGDEPESEQPSNHPKFEMGRRYLPPHAEQVWTYIPYETDFPDVPAVFVMPGGEGTTSCDARVRNVDEYGFEVACLRPKFEPRPQGGVTLTFLAIEKGAGYIGEQQIDVDCHGVDQIQTGLPEEKARQSGWQTVPFSQPFRQRPYVLTELQSDHAGRLTDEAVGPHNTLISPAVGSVSRVGLAVAIDFHEQRVSNRNAYEEICYAAFSEGVFETGATENPLTCSVGSSEISSREKHGAQGLPKRRVSLMGKISKLLDALEPDLAMTSVLRDPGRPRSLWERLQETHDQVVAQRSVFLVASLTSRYVSDGGWVRGGFANDGVSQLFVEEDRSYDVERAHGNERVDFLYCR